MGTSGCKVLLVDETGAVLAQASAEYPLSVPEPLWSEQDPEDWWKGVQQCLSEIDISKVDAIGVTAQMHGAVFLDANEAVIRPAILWNDQRTVQECADINQIIGSERVKEITCNPPLTGFQLPKLLWLRKHEPENYSRVASLLLPKDFIRLRLTGEKVTEVSDASGTGIFDVVNRTWSSEMISTLGLSASFFPRVVESDEITGHTKAGVPVVGGGGDQAAGAVGTGTVEPGIISVSLGTSGVVFTALNEPNYDKSGATHTFCHANRSWHGMGVMLSCGGALRWVRDTFFPGMTYDEMSALAATSPVGAQGLTFLPYLSGERCPHNDPAARGSLTGLTLAHDRSDVARAVFEGLSIGLLDGLDRLRSLGALTSEIRVTSGGSKSHFWVQMLADMFGSPCVSLESDEGPAFGAALLAGVGIKLWPDVATACRATIRTKSKISPSGADYTEPISRYRDLYPHLKPWFNG